MIFLILFINILPIWANDDLLKSEHLTSKTDLSEDTHESIVNTQNSSMLYLPGDGLSISTFPDTTSFLNKVFQIDDRGYVDFPLVGKAQVSNMTEEQLVTFVRDNFKLYTRSPNVSIKSMLRLSMIGGFIRPGLFYVDYDMSFWNAIQLSGGPVLEDGIKEMQWERNGVRVKDDLRPFYEQGVSLKSMGFKSGDIIWTPSPGAETTLDIIIRDVIPILAFATTIMMAWLAYQNASLIYSTR
jgi:protein involved in polysaccharide export with SLBB domain